MVKKLQTLSNNKKFLQEQVGRLNNEIEELQLEREESKKNVLHFMQEADAARQQLKKAQELIDELIGSNNTSGCQSPPPEQETEQKPKLSFILSKISLLNEDKLSRLLQTLDEPDQVNNLKLQLEQAQIELIAQKSENISLRDELDQLKEEYKATRGALQIENERAEIVEKRWKESESHLEQAEFTIQALNRDLDFFRQQQQEWALTTTMPDNSLSDELCKLEKKHTETIKQLALLQSCLDEKEKISNTWQEKHHELNLKMDNKQDEIDAAKIRENHLKTINKTLRDEIRKLQKVEEDIINIEYLRNVIIKFLEKRNTRAQLVPILSTLLQCSNDDQARLRKLINKKSSNSNSRRSIIA